MDDPYDVEGVLRSAEREHTEFVFDEVLPSRFNHPTRNALVMAAQRTHRRDLHAHIMESADYELGLWRYDCIPGFLEKAPPDSKRHPPVSDGDPRQPVDGQVYWPERFDEESLMGLVKTAHARAGQIQQNPQQRGAGVFRNANWQFADDWPRALRLVRYWDKAATPADAGGDPDYTAGALGGRDESGRFWLIDMQRDRWSSHQVEQRIGSSQSSSTSPGPKSTSRKRAAAPART